METQDKKYLFFYLKTGGGHLAPARAIAAMIAKLSNNSVNTVLIDGLQGASSYAKSSIEDGYRFSVNKAKWIFELLYLCNKVPFIAQLTATFVSLLVKKSLEKQILEHNPEKIVILHFFLIRPIYSILKKHGLQIPVVTVVTDPFTAHPLWFLQDNQQFVVFSNELQRSLIARYGYNESQVEVFPFVLDEQFSTPPSHEDRMLAKQELGFSLNKPVVLIMGGGDGIPHGKSILRSVMRNNANAEIAIVCGKNEKLFQFATSLKQELCADNLKVYGYVNFVHKLINCADVVITKCGASTFMEILMMKKIPIINNYIWEQEKGNMEYVKNNKMGVYERNINQLPKLINILFKNNDYYNTFLQNISKAKLENGNKKVAEFILQYNKPLGSNHILA